MNFAFAFKGETWNLENPFTRVHLPNYSVMVL